MSTTPNQNSGNFIVNYFKEFGVLRETRIEYWGIQLINLLDSTMLFALVTMGPLLLSQDFGFSDPAAGWVMTLYGSGTTICLFFFGAVTDWLGIRRSFYVSQLGLFITRGAILLMAFTPGLPVPVRNTILVVAFGLMAPFVAMVITVFQAANKRFTTGKSRSAGFNAWYVFMNFGAAGAGLLVDFVRFDLKAWLNLSAPANVYVMAYGACSAIICIVLTFIFVRREEQLYGPGEELAEPAPEAAKSKKDLFSIAGTVIREPVFWRFLVLVSLLLGVRAVFLHMHLLMPKFWERTIGPDALIGKLQMVNPVLVVAGLILLIPFLKRFTVYGMLVWGSMISAVSLFFLAIPAVGHQVYYTSVICLIVLTVGEVIWSPRLTEYTAAIAPEGQEGTYLGLSMVPYFLAKTVVSALSGYMLVYWCPVFEEGPSLIERLTAGSIPFWRTPSAMWIILGAWALSGPFIALAMKRWFTKGAHWTKEEKEAAEAQVATTAASDSNDA